MTGPVPVRDLAVRRLGLGLGEAGDADETRTMPIETPIAVEINGIGYAVMMATPADLADYALGFVLGEGLAEHPGQVQAIDVHRLEAGWIVRVALPPERAAPVLERARMRVSESSCGLCGIESIEALLRPLPPVRARIRTTRAAIARALGDLRGRQPLSRATGAVHAAAFCTPEGEIVAAREDVGRHNALDKLIGALAAAGRDPAAGFILLTARCSYELVEKTVRANCSMLVTISAPTSLAVERARAAGLTLVTLARPDSALLVSDPHGALA